VENSVKLENEVNLENMRGKCEEMHYKITIFGACAPYPRLINILNCIVYLAR